MLLVVFGLPGAGKSFVADILRESFGYVVYDGDADIPNAMRQSLWKKERITDGMRTEFVATLIASVARLSRSHPKLAVHQTFIKEFMRRSVLQAFPHAKFLLVEADAAIRETRYRKRKYFNLGLTYLRHMCALFEPAIVPHTIIHNSSDGPLHVIHQLTSFFAQNSLQST